MMSSRPRHRASFPLLAAALAAGLASQGCVAFTGGEIPERPEQPGAPHGKTPVSYEVAFTNGGEPAPAVAVLLAPSVDEGLKTSGVFSEVKPGNDIQPHIKISVDDDGAVALAVITGIFCGLSLTVLPGFGIDDYTMTATVERDGKVLKTYEYQGSVTTVQELFMVFGMPFNDGTADHVNNLVADMTHQLALDIERDGILR